MLSLIIMVISISIKLFTKNPGLERAARRLSNTEDTRVIEIRSAHQLAVAPVFNWVFQPVGEGEFTLEEDRRQLAPVLQSMVRKKLHFHLVRGNWHDYRLMLNLQRVQYRNLPINPIEDMIPGFESDLQDPAAFAAASFLHQNGFRSVDQRSPEGGTDIDPHTHTCKCIYIYIIYTYIYIYI